ncbi:unnamed protein product, partial [Sphacelaria rigidula]
KSEYKEIWLSTMRAELDGHETAGTFPREEIPKGVNIITAKWVSSWKTDANGAITKVKARIVARRFGQRFPVDINQFIMAVAKQRGWPLYHFDVTQAIVRVKMDTNVFMKLPGGCAHLMGSKLRLEKFIYGIKEAG